MTVQSRTASAPSKVNLTLHVGPADESGYHALVSTFEALSLRDYVTVRRVDDRWSDKDSRQDTRRVRSFIYDVPANGDRPGISKEHTEEFATLDPEQHLALRACRALGLGDRVELTVHKTIPVAGGMAGGSADAAAALVAANDLFELGHSFEDLQRIGATLGADVPACLVGGIALGIGRGDQMTPLRAGTEFPDADSHWWALALAEDGLSTPQVFHAFDDLAVRRSQARLSGDLPGNLSGAVPSGHFCENALALQDSASFSMPVPAAVLSGLLTNDLMPAALAMRPELADVGRAMMETRPGEPSALGWVVSGSGPTVAGLASSREEAQAIATRVLSQPGVRGVAVGWGPGVGARVESALPDWVVEG